MERNLTRRAEKAKKLFLNVTDEYDSDELYAAIKRANNDFSYLEPYWQWLILKAEALDAKIQDMPYNEKRQYLTQLDQERRKKRERIWHKNLPPEYKEFLKKIHKDEEGEK